MVSSTSLMSFKSIPWLSGAILMSTEISSSSIRSLMALLEESRLFISWVMYTETSSQKTSWLLPSLLQLLSLTLTKLNWGGQRQQAQWEEPLVTIHWGQIWKMEAPSGMYGLLQRWFSKLICRSESIWPSNLREGHRWRVKSMRRNLRLAKPWRCFCTIPSSDPTQGLWRA